MKRIYFLAFLLPMTLNAQTFTEATTGIKNFFYSSSDVGDVNNDGKLDIIYNGQLDHDNDGYTDETVNEVYVNNNGSYAVFGDLGVYGTNLGDIKFIDFNNDGLQDIVSTGLGETNFTHYRFENNGSGFTKVHETVGKVYSSIEVFDFNHDGLQDYGINGPLSSGNFSHDISFYQNNGNGFGYTESWLPGTQNGSFNVVDFNNDQLLDVVVMGYDVNNDSVFKTYINTNGALQFSQSLTPLNKGEMSFADFNADGFQDLVAIGQEGNNELFLGVFMNDGTGNLIANPIASEGLVKASVDVGDLNNDGYYDFVVIGDKTNTEGFVNVFIYDPVSTTFNKASGTSLYNLGGTGDLKLLDFDGDHHLDVLMTGFDRSNSILPAVTKLFKNNSTQTNQKPTAPTNLNVIKTGNRFDFTWSGATDDKTPVNVLQYEIKVGTTPGSQDLAKYIVTTPSWFLELDSSIQDVYWSVKSIDAAKVYSDSSVQSTTLGVQDHISKAQFAIYPNPASDKIFIKGEKAENVEIYSIDGKKLTAELDNNQSLNVSHLPKGVYLLKVKIKGNWSSKKLIIK